MNYKFVCTALTICLSVASSRASEAQTYTTTSVPTDSGPFDVAVNPVTNKIYVSNSTGQNVSVIDGTTDAVVATIDTPDSLNPGWIAVNSATNAIFVLYGGNANGQQQNGLMKIDGVSDTSVGTYPLPIGANAFAVNPVTNLIYVADFWNNALLIFDGLSAGPDIPPITSIPVGSGPGHLAVNSVTNKIYVGNSFSRDVTVVDGATYSTATFQLDRSPVGLAVNPANNKVYVVEGGSQTVNGEVAVIDANNNSIVTLTLDGNPGGYVTVDPHTNNVYVSSYSQNLDGTFNPGTVTVIYATNNAIPITAGTYPLAIAVDPVFGKVYVADWALTGYVNQNVNCDVIVIDANDNSATSVDLGVDTYPFGVAASSFTHKVYTANNNTNDVTVITPASNGNTPKGTNASVTPAAGLTVMFTQVTAAGDTTAVADSTPPPPSGFQLDGLIYDISTTATYVPPVTVCIAYSPGDSNPRLYHYENIPPQQWVDRTASVDAVNHVVCGIVSSLSPFAVLTPVAASVHYSVRLLYDPTKAKKSGSAYPIQIQLYDSHNPNLSSPSIVVHAVSVTQVSTNAPGTLADAGNSNPDFDFRYDAALGGYIFNLKTTGLATGTYSLSFTAGSDPTLHTAMFQIK